MRSASAAPPRLCPRPLPLLVGVTVALALSACGGDGGGTSAQPPSTVNTLAYVVTECTEDAAQATARQALKIRQRNGETITVAEFPMLGPIPPLGLCRIFGESSNGPGSVLVLPFQRLGVSPDGSVVVFEVTDDYSFVRALLPHGLVPPEQEGFFAVNADGSHLRKLGPASRDPGFRYAVDPSVPFGMLLNLASFLGFSPDGQRVYLTDLGPGPDGQEAVQVFILELATGVRTQITQLPPLTPTRPVSLTVGYPGYGGPGVVGFGIDSVESDGFVSVLTRADGGGEIRRERPPVATGGGVIPRFAITPNASFAAAVTVPGTPVNPQPGDPSPQISEVFVFAGDNRLQLTQFGRSDTGGALSMLSADALRVLFVASADPLNSNPDHDCQFFSISTLGVDLRRLTNWSNGFHGDCTGNGPGCFIGTVGQDLAGDRVLFSSNCSPFSANPKGLELLAMGFDGSGLQQLTSTRGMTTDPDGTVHAELPGPWAYPEVFR